MGTGCSFTES